MLLIKTIYGSRLYGMETETSDTDLRLVYTPSYENLVLGTRPDFKVVGDHEAFTLEKFLKGFAEGQSYALEIAHAKGEAILESHGSWQSVLEFLPEIYTKNIAATVDFARSMANRYIVRAERYNAVLAFIDFLSKLNPDARLRDYALPAIIPTSEHLHMSTVQNVGKDEISVKLCDRHYLVNNTVGHTLTQVTALANSYGKRVTNNAASTEEDWKSLAHAYRLADEACEWIELCAVTLPRPNKELLKDIRFGRLSLTEVNEMLDEKLAELGTLVAKSTLPTQPNYTKINEFVLGFYRDTHREEINGP